MPINYAEAMQCTPDALADAERTHASLTAGGHDPLGITVDDVIGAVAFLEALEATGFAPARPSDQLNLALVVANATRKIHDAQDTETAVLEMCKVLGTCVRYLGGKKAKTARPKWRH